MQHLTCLLLLATLSFSHITAQNNEEFFKVPPFALDEATTPNWAKLMYSENPNVDEVSRLYQEYYQKNPFIKNSHTQNFKHWNKNIMNYVAPDGYIKIPSIEEEQLQLQKLKDQRNQAARSTNIWSNIGPFDTYNNNGSLTTRPTQANVSSIAVAPSNHDIMYCGAATGGGVFKSIDHGLNWELATLEDPIKNAIDIKIHPTDPNIVYICDGSKIFKTIDGGTNWVLNYTAPNTVEQFYIHKTQPTTVFAATKNGLLKTVDSGANWVNVFNKRCWDIEPHATNPDIIYLSTSNATKKRAEIFKSIDAGLNWELKDSLWYEPTDIDNASDIGCKIGVTPADPDRVYAALIGSSKAGDNGWIGIYYSLDGAESWVNADSIDGGPYEPGNNMNTNWYVAGYSSGYHQGWYNFDMDVSHINPDKLWVGTIWSCESGNRGANIEYIRGTRSLSMHADVQDIDVVGNEIWYTSDGGINYSNDEMQTVEVRNSGISASTYWGFSQGWNEDVWTGGRYHNGDAVHHENYGTGNTLFLGGAESPTGYINPQDNRLMHFSDIRDKKISNELSIRSANAPNLSLYPNQAYTLLNSSEIEYHPNYSNEMYLGNRNVFYKSINGGVIFDSLYTFPSGSRVLGFEISRLDPSVIYCLVKQSNIGTIYKSIDGGTTFNATTNVPTNNHVFLDLSLDPYSTDKLWVISANGANGRKVYMTNDGGLTWVNKTTPTLDGHKIVDILYQAGSNEVAYIVSNNSVFYWDKTSNDWIMYSSGLPFFTRALYFKPFYRDNKIRLASDRGIWEAPFADNALPKAEPMTYTSKVNCERDVIQFDDHSVLNHENASWLWSFNPAPASINSTTIRNPEVTFTENGTYDVTLTITDGFGNSDTKTITNIVTVENQCVPDSVPGLALECNASPDFAYTPDFDLDSVTNFTISAWVKPNGIQKSYSGIVFNDGSSAGLNFKNNNQLAYHWPGGQWSWNSGLFVDTTLWSHVALVADPTGITLYLNGVASKHNRNLSPVDIGTMKIGSYKGWSSRNYNGKIDEVCIWNKSLSIDEIRALRHLTRTGSNPFLTDLVAYYQFNFEDDVRILDNIGNKHSTLNGRAKKSPSDAPVGGGESHRMTVNAAGNSIFQNTGLEINFEANHPNGEVVVSRLNTLPNHLPNNNSHTGNYWIINNYGSSDFDAINALKFKPNLLSPFGDPVNAKLYSRVENEHQNNWVELCSAIDYTDESFNYNASCNVTNTAQFFIQSDNANIIAKEFRYKSQSVEICSNDSILLGGNYQNEADIYYDTININPILDSVFITSLSVSNTSAYTDLQTACNSYTWIDGNTYMANNNTASVVLTNKNGCDSVVTLDLTINNSNTSMDVQTACDSYTWMDGNTYTANNNLATFTLTNSSGCDSVITLNLTINNSNSYTDEQTACDSYTWIDGNTYTANNNDASITLTNDYGCDSTVTLDLTINSSSTYTDVQTACDSYTWIDGITYTSNNNSASQTLTNSVGCDSIVTLDLTINSSSTYIDNRTACDSYTWIDGNTYTANNNTASVTLTNDFGCDSIVTLNLSILNNASFIDVQTACDTYTWSDGNTYTSDNNSASQTLTSSIGCDSVVTLNLTINNSNSYTDEQTACDSYTWIDGNTYTANNNDASITLTNDYGCDSTVTLDLTINSSSTYTDVQTACDSYTWIDGITYTSNNNIASQTLTNSVGCDSIVTLDLTINSSSTYIDNRTACDSYTWIDGNTYTANNNTASVTLTNDFGCDSIVTLNLTINQSSAYTDVQSACERFTWINKVTYTESNNTASLTLTNSQGCDSVITLNLTIYNGSTFIETQTACDSYTWIDGVTYIESNNSASHTLTSSQGCDSIVNLNLTINSTSTFIDEKTACDSYTWIDGITYTSNNNSASQILTNSVGCDSIVTLDLIINQSSTYTDVQSACNSYTWIDGITYTESNDEASKTYTNHLGCDSIVTLNLEITNIDTDLSQSGLTLTAEQSTGDFQWINCNGNMIIEQATDQSFTPTINGDYAVIVSENNCIDTSACINITAVSVLENTFDKAFEIYPNPVKDVVFINMEKTYDDLEVSLVSIDGRVINNLDYKQNLNEIEVAMKGPAGVYFIRIVGKKGQIATLKIVKL